MPDIIVKTTNVVVHDQKVRQLMRKYDFFTIVFVAPLNRFY